MSAEILIIVGVSSDDNFATENVPRSAPAGSAADAVSAAASRADIAVAVSQ